MLPETAGGPPAGQALLLRVTAWKLRLRPSCWLVTCPEVRRPPGTGKLVKGNGIPVTDLVAVF